MMMTTMIRLSIYTSHCSGWLNTFLSLVQISQLSKSIFYLESINLLLIKMQTESKTFHIKEEDTKKDRESKSALLP